MNGLVLKNPAQGGAVCPAVEEAVRSGLKGLIFDCDGVVLDTRQAYGALFQAMFRNLGLGPMGARQEEEAFGFTKSQVVQTFIPAPLQEAALEYLRENGIREYRSVIRPMPGIDQALAQLRQRGLVVALNTNTGDEIRGLLDRFDLLESFRMVVTSDDVSAPKPDPEGALLIMNRFGLEPSRVAYVGDTDVDGRTARAAGVHFWSFGSRLSREEFHLPAHLA